MKPKKAVDAAPEIEVVQIVQGGLRFPIVGVSPLIANRMSEKVKHELLLPPRKSKNRAERALTLKHEPLTEYRNSPYTTSDPKAPTRIIMPAGSFKNALASVAIDMPGASKAEIGRLTWVTTFNVPIWGVPQLFMSVTRNSDMNHTPDVRTRAILPEWATVLDINFVQSLLNAKTVANLLAAAGIMRGVGDWRPEKGKGSFGQFRICEMDDPAFVRIMKEQGKAAQDAALEDPGFYDDETREMYTWFGDELRRRGDEVRSTGTIIGKQTGNGGVEA